MPGFSPGQHEEGLKLDPTELGLGLGVANESSRRSPERQFFGALLSRALFSSQSSRVRGAFLSLEPITFWRPSLLRVNILGVLIFLECFSRKALSSWSLVLLYQELVAETGTSE